MLIQQGDVLIQSVDEIPADAKPIDRRAGKFVLAEGEVTGHAHVVTNKAAMLFDSNNVMFMAVTGTKPVTVKHEEHHKVTVPPGKYRVSKVKEYDHFAEEARAVQD